jgi:hypothetical protein
MDQFGSITHFLQDKNILVLGATGFLAKSNIHFLSLSLLNAYVHIYSNLKYK